MISLTLPTFRHPHVEAIDMLARRFSYFPRTFVWRGQKRHVESVQRVWTVKRGKTIDRIYFLVRCADWAFTIYQDIHNNTWHIQL